MPIIFRMGKLTKWRRHNYYKNGGIKNPKCDKRFTPLHYAAKNGHEEICSLILDEVTDKNPKSKEGLTPFDYASRQGHTQIYKLIQGSLLCR